MSARRVTINGREQIDPRQTRAWTKLRDQVVREEPTCRLRFPTICTTISTTADHITPVSVRPDLALERTNCRGACRPCNEAKHNLPNSALVLNGERSEALSIFQ